MLLVVLDADTIIIPLVVVFGYLGLNALWSYSIDDRYMNRMQRVANWPEAQGVVKKSAVKFASIRVDYEYVADGHVRQGVEKIVFPESMVIGANRWTRVSDARALGNRVKRDLADYAPGQHVVIRYNPQDPEDSVLYVRGDVQHADPNAKSVEAPHFKLVS
jgi:hypothetical protein